MCYLHLFRGKIIRTMNNIWWTVCESIYIFSGFIHIACFASLFILDSMFSIIYRLTSVFHEQTLSKSPTFVPDSERIFGCTCDPFTVLTLDLPLVPAHAPLLLICKYAQFNMQHMHWQALPGYLASESVHLGIPAHPWRRTQWTAGHLPWCMHNMHSQSNMSAKRDLCCNMCWVRGAGWQLTVWWVLRWSYYAALSLSPFRALLQSSPAYLHTTLWRIVLACQTGHGTWQLMLW